MHPEPGQWFASGTLALRNFIFVMGKLQVHSTAMNVKRLTEGLTAHGRAFNVPAGAATSVVIWACLTCPTCPTCLTTARTAHAIPFGIFGLERLGRFPQHKVQRIALVVLYRNPLTRAQVIQRFARQLAIAGELAHCKIHVATGRLVGQALDLQPVDQVQHLGHVFGGARLHRRRLNAQPANVGAHDLNHFISERTDGDVALKRPLDDLVVNVGDVAHVGHTQAVDFQPALNHIKCHRHAGVTDVAQVINRHAADIHADMAGLNWGKLFQGTRQRVVDAQAHGAIGG